MARLLYKFYPAYWGRDALYRERFKVTTLEDINDPFEFLATGPRRELRNEARRLRKSKFGKEGVICFCGSWREPLMWSHYAENHKGMALGFELDTPRNGYAVDYSAERVQMPDRKKLESGQLLNFWTTIRVRKYLHWSYEQEVRVFPPLNASDFENGLFFWPFSKLGNLREVILGHEYKQNVDQSLHEKLVANGIQVRTARLGFKRFEVVEQGAKKLQKAI